MCSWRYFGRAKADPSAPRAAGICQRCDFTYQLSELKYQYEYRGVALASTGFKVCPRCLDVPAQFLKTIILPVDPQIVDQPRPNQFQKQMNNSSPVLTWDQSNGRWDSSSGGGTESVWL